MKQIQQIAADEELFSVVIISAIGVTQLSIIIN